MTAINAVVLAEETHLFSDAGHYDPDSLILRSIREKVFRLPRVPAVLAFSGPSRGGEALLREMEREEEGAFLAFPEAVERMIAEEGIECGYTAILLGPSRGLAIEEGGRMTHLRPGSVIKSLPSPIRFDPENITASGLAMVIDQRARHKVVSGFCQHTVIRPEGVVSRILHRWPDEPAPAGSDTIAAKIANLTVDTLNIAPGAVTGVVSASGSGSGTTVSATVPNPFNFPIKILCKCPYSYSGTASDSSASIEFIIKRGSTVIFDQQISISGNGSKTGFLNPAFIDAVSGSQTYSLQCKALGDPNGSGGVMVMTGSFTLTCAYTQK